MKNYFLGGLTACLLLLSNITYSAEITFIDSIGMQFQEVQKNDNYSIENDTCNKGITSAMLVGAGKEKIFSFNVVDGEVVEGEGVNGLYVSPSEGDINYFVSADNKKACTEMIKIGVLAFAHCLKEADPKNCLGAVLYKDKESNMLINAYQEALQ